ncbi:DUF1214 domain-containing protein [Rhizobium sp. TRM96647]|uniref:DUF1214 domain-containing protein n=1 Tax=unclassified Rhizobium TaxID=2613769 RepID=UPI0021E7FE03|nr:MULTISPECIES: DUF1214 domain-containing protein [unclassified Rhizobium]MCV3739051.1 DUF1214 domain-containing protein [Rhizobium sp. TRM96647]MCV3760550.1 DUF1214 domain-containing protein [Rhizobium sp. TRM96650]
MTHRLPAFAFTIAFTFGCLPSAGQAAEAVPVTPDNFIRAESDMYFAVEVAGSALGKLQNRREMMPIDRQTVIRSNRDTLYSSAVFDLDAGPVTVSMPDAGTRFMSLVVIDEDHYVPFIAHGKGSHTFTREQIGTRYMLVGVRTLVNSEDPADLRAVHALQDAIAVEQAGPGQFEIPDWDKASQKTIRDALLVLNTTLPDLRHTFGSRGEVDPIRHLIGTAAAWGGNPDKEAIYLNVTPKHNDGRTVYRLSVRDVPVDGFWSISVYNAQGFFVPNALNAYSLNNLTAAKEDDGTVRIQFGGCDAQSVNCLPTPEGWNYMVRLYQPQAAILDGSWQFPGAQQVP